MPAQEEPLRISGRILSAKTRNGATVRWKLHKLNVNWSTRVTDRQTDGHTTAYSMLSMGVARDIIVSATDSQGRPWRLDTRRRDSRPCLAVSRSSPTLSLLPPQLHHLSLRPPPAPAADQSPNTTLHKPTVAIHSCVSRVKSSVVIFDIRALWRHPQPWQQWASKG